MFHGQVIYGSDVCKRAEVDFVIAVCKIRDGVIPVTRRKDEGIIISPAAQYVITGAAVNRIITVPPSLPIPPCIITDTAVNIITDTAEDTVIAVLTVHPVIAAIRTAIQGIVTVATHERVVAEVAGQYVIV